MESTIETYKNRNGPEILKSEAISSLAKMNRNEVAGPNGIVKVMPSD